MSGLSADDALRGAAALLGEADAPLHPRLTFEAGASAEAEASVLLARRAAAQVIALGIHMTGKEPSVAEMWRWVRRGVPRG